MARKLLIVTASVETPIGLMLLLSPPLVAGLLLGVSLDAPAALIVGRKIRGQIVETETRTVSDNGKELTVTIKGNRDGTE